MQTMQSNTTAAPVVRAPGQDVLDRLMAWATPVKKGELGNLRLAWDQKLVESDEKARDMLAALLRNMAQANDLRETAKAALRTFNRYGLYARETGGEIYVARQNMARMVQEKTELRRETLAYGRMVQKLNGTAAGGERDELAKQVAATKQALDDKRADHNAAMKTAKEELESAEDQLLGPFREKAVLVVVELLSENKSCLEQSRSIRKQLEVDLNAFEDYVASLG